jgi:phosphoribosylanthranilate isomerase
MKLKICGIRTIEDVECVNQAGVDYAGFVLTPHRLQISVEEARVLKTKLNADIKTVGVFLDDSPKYINNIIAKGIVDMVQFHGKTEFKTTCPSIRAFMVQTESDIKPTFCDFVLFDAFKKGVRGATGGKFNWRLVEGYSDKPFFIAGGITAENVREAIKLKPYCIDICSGAEENGQKSLKKIVEIKQIMNEMRGDK